METSSHGDSTKREQPFTRIFDHPVKKYDPAQLLKLANAIADSPDSVKDGADPEENGMVPAGYTYFGQFVDHDLTFDSTSSLNPADTVADGTREPSNLRTPRLDLDCLYGDGPDAQPYMYDVDGASLLFQHSSPDTKLAQKDLMRSPTGRAIIGDKRNDENSIVSQIQFSFVQFHNAVVDHFKGLSQDSLIVPGNLFQSARREVTWTYQHLLLHDYLPRIIHHEVLQDLQKPVGGKRNFVLYKAEKGLRDNLPREFVAAAYRFGHSMVRSGYRLNGELNNRFHIFASSTPQANELKENPPSLIGFDPLPANHVIDDWKRFFPTAPHPSTADLKLSLKADGDAPDVKVRMQFAYKIDTKIVDPLSVLPRNSIAGNSTAEQAENAIAPARLPDKTGRPSLALLNLVRGDRFELVSGQVVADAILAAGLRPKDSTLPLPLEPAHLSTRGKVAGKDGIMQFTPIDAYFKDNTPLWFYLLAEAQAPLVDALWPGKAGASSPQFNEDKLLEPHTNHTQLGWVGGRIVAEVFYGILESDAASLLNAGQHGPNGCRTGGKRRPRLPGV